MKRFLAMLMGAAALAVGLYAMGYLPLPRLAAGNSWPEQAVPAKPDSQAKRTVAERPPAVTVVDANTAALKETVLVNGNLVPRLEVLVAPEVEGQRVLELLAEEGDKVKKGQVLARLESETLRTQLAQNDASLARAAAAIAQARDNIVAAEARQVETKNALDRALPLRKSGTIAESTLDQRESAAQSAAAQLAVARSGLMLSEAEKAQIEAQRRDLSWKLGKTEIKAPVDGLVSRRSARIGAVASGSPVAEPMFRLIANGLIELEADVPEPDLARIKQGQKADVLVAGSSPIDGEVRLVMPEIDKSTRQGRVRIALPENPALKIGGFGRASVHTRSVTALAVPAAAVMFGAEGAYVQVVRDGRISTRPVVTGLQAGALIEIRSGLVQGETVVAKAGTFLRAGDQVTPVRDDGRTITLN
jgi:RND family efflux transporter MFP subunit